MRILYVIDSLAIGGAERSLAAMAPHLVARGVDLRVACFSEGRGVRADLEAARVPVTVLESAGRLARAARAQHVAALARSLRADLVHTTLFEADIAGRVGARLARVPVVSTFAVTAYGAEHVHRPDLSSAKVRAAQALDALTARLVRRFHAVSGVVAATMADRLRVPRDRIDVVWRGRDASVLGRRTEDRRAGARAQLGVADDVPVLLAVARQEPDKGLDVAVAALPAVRAAWPQARLVVAGAPGAATTDLRVRAGRHDIEGAVTLLGSRDDIADLLSAADVFVAPSRREGLPGAVIEAMALEAPIVASDLPAIEEVVGPGTALLVPVDDAAALAKAVVATVADPEAARGRARLARERFEQHFTIERAVDGMIAFYGRATGPRR